MRQRGETLKCYPLLYYSMGRTTTHEVDALLEMALDATPGEAYNQGRLKTVETENGVALVAYHEHILADIDRFAESVTLYTGHHGSHSQTVDKYISRFGFLLNERPDYSVQVLEGYAPTTGHGRVSEAGQYIGEYVSPWGRQSPAERAIVKSVNQALASHL